MEEMKETYIQEANELLENLESSLLSLEDNPNDKSNIEQVFRVMHTLKGNSSMFGLTKIAEFVHDLETIYDKIRQGEMQLSREILNTTLASFDHLNLIIIDSELEEQENKENHTRLINEIHKFIGKGGVHTNAPAESKAENNEIIKTEIVEGPKTYHIHFEPNESIFLNGSNPLYLVAELAGLGKSIVVPHFKSVASIVDFDPTKCFTYWDVYLETDKLITDIQDVFVFVEGDSKIEITEIPFIDLISNASFNEVVNGTMFKDVKINLKPLILPASVVEAVV